MASKFCALFLVLGIVAFSESVDNDMRIVGGDEASPGEFPYQIFIENVWNSSEILKCGGAIYSPEYVLTAAHCVYFKDTGTYANPKRMWVTAGTHDLESKDENIKSYQQVVKVTEIIPHPKFQYKKHDGDMGTIPTYDIALLKLSPPLKLSERTQPIPIATADFTVQGNGTVTGFGRPDPYGKWTKQLRKVDIPLVDWQECAKLFKGYASIDKDMFCSGTKEGGVTPCNGDSGGPVACRNNGNPEGAPFLCGIASFGPNRCPNYSVYTRVASYGDWIREVTRAA